MEIAKETLNSNVFSSSSNKNSNESNGMIWSKHILKCPLVSLGNSLNILIVRA